MDEEKKSLGIKNPFIFAPIKLGYSDGDGRVNQKYIAFYQSRSQYLGAVTVEPLYMDKGLREIPTQLGIDVDDKIEGLKRLTKSIHNSDTKAIAHLNHPGRMANPKLPGNYYVSSTDSPCENGGATPKRMDQEDIDSAIKLFQQSAKRAEKANFDMVELQFGHGYLLAQFISPLVNDREDKYGGGFENRIKFPLEVLQAVRDSIDIPIIVRISGDEMLSEGIKLPEMIKLSGILEERGADAVHVSAGTVCSTPPWFFQHMFVPKGKTWDMGKEISKNIDIPVIFVGKINSLEDIEDAKNQYSADYIAIGRGLVADPKIVGKYLGKEDGPIRPCLSCVEGCLGGVKSGAGLQCLVNPEVGQKDKKIEKAVDSKRFAVVGGGLAGMEAALTLKRRGHDVDLYEKDTLGGQFNYASLTPNKKSMSRLVPYFKEELKRQEVNVIFEEASVEDIASQYDNVILATGSEPFVPPIPGLDDYYWADILLEENIPENKKILIIGGGLVGVDIATALIARNNKVIIVKRTTDFGEDMEMMAKKLSLKSMRKKDTVFSDHTNIQRIKGDTVFAEKKGDEITFEGIDEYVVSTGTRSYNPLEEKLKGKIPVHLVGDAKEVGDAQDAIKSAYETAKDL